jgi:hypothetical protein
MRSDLIRLAGYGTVIRRMGPEGPPMFRRIAWETSRGDQQDDDRGRHGPHVQKANGRHPSAARDIPAIMPVVVRIGILFERKREGGVITLSVGNGKSASPQPNTGDGSAKLRLLRLCG